MKKAKAKLDELCSSNWSTPKLQAMSPGGTSSESTGKRRRTTETPSTLNKEVSLCNRHRLLKKCMLL